MKKSFFIAALVTVFSAASFAVPNTGTIELSSTSKFQVVENTDSHFDLYYVSENIGKVSVRILDAKGKVVNIDNLPKIKAFKRTYNLKDLPTGNYTLEVKNKEGKASQKIYHNIAKSTTLHSIVGQVPNTNKFKLLVGPSEVSTTQVKIFNQQGNIVLQETIKDSKGFTKVYDLSAIAGEQVTFNVSNGKDSNSFIRELE